MKRTRTTLYSLALASLFTVLATAQAWAICPAPNLTVSSGNVCKMGENCDISIDLATGGDSYVGATATLSSSVALGCQNTCTAGSAAGGICNINAAACTWNVTDFSLTPFSDGEVVVVTLQCGTLGTFSLDLSDVSLSTPGGTPVVEPDTCGHSANFDCVECTNDGECGGGETCDPSGVCVECLSDGDCTDGNECTVDSCESGTCSNNAALADGDSCDDEIFCTATDTCSGGSCSGAGDPCPGTECADTCNEAGDTCFDAPGTSCSDGDMCTVGDQCDGAGSCSSGAPPDCSGSDSACAVGACNPSDGNCFADPLPPGTSCSDGAFCNGDETCNAMSACQAGTPPTLSDGVGCTDDSCDEAGDVVVHTANNTNCDNGAFCDGDETCDTIADCQAGTAPVSDDGVDCTNDSCDELNDVVVNTTDDSNCDDGLFCNGAETCHATLDCQAGFSPCSDGVGCTLDGCDEPSDSCVNSPSDMQCDDGQACNGAETCDATLGCQSELPVDCEELDDDCSFGTCSDDDGGCISQPFLDGTSCEDGNACTLDDECTDGLCIRTTFCGVPITRGDKPLVSDALFILRASIGLESCTICECDVNTDLMITVSDALGVLQASVGIPVTLYCFLPLDEALVVEEGSAQ